jgi:hypothetical protein
MGRNATATTTATKALLWMTPVLAVLIAGGGGGGTPAAAKQDDRCDNGSISGSYGYTVTGTNLGVGQVAAVGRVTADGRGGLTATDTLSAAGTILRRTITGSYAVNPNCTGSGQFTDNFGLTVHLDFVITNRGDEFQFIQTDPGTVFTGAAKRI